MINISSRYVGPVCNINFRLAPFSLYPDDSRVWNQTSEYRLPGTALESNGDLYFSTLEGSKVVWNKISLACSSEVHGVLVLCKWLDLIDLGVQDTKWMDIEP